VKRPGGLRNLRRICTRETVPSHNAGTA
jgi:hypothetical protein